MFHIDSPSISWISHWETSATPGRQIPFIGFRAFKVLSERIVVICGDVITVVAFLQQLVTNPPKYVFLFSKHKIVIATPRKGRFLSH